MANAIVGNIVHAAGVRYRVKGSGQLRSRLYNMSEDVAEMRYSDLDNIDLSAGAARQKTILANFQDQGIQLSFRTIHINETINVTSIICFVKPVAESYPIVSGG